MTSQPTAAAAVPAEGAPPATLRCAAAGCEPPRRATEECGPAAIRRDGSGSGGGHLLPAFGGNVGKEDMA